MDTVKAVLAVLGLDPHHVLSMVVATLVSWGATQGAKPLLLWFVNRRHRGRCTQLLAFVLGFAAVVVLEPSRLGVLLGAVVGLWSPPLWQLNMVVLGKWKPEWRATLSGSRGE